MCHYRLTSIKYCSWTLPGLELQLHLTCKTCFWRISSAHDLWNACSILIFSTTFPSIYFEAPSLLVLMVWRTRRWGRFCFALVFRGSNTFGVGLRRCWFRIRRASHFFSYFCSVILLMLHHHLLLIAHFIFTSLWSCENTRLSSCLFCAEVSRKNNLPLSFGDVDLKRPMASLSCLCEDADMEPTCSSRVDRVILDHAVLSSRHFLGLILRWLDQYHVATTSAIEK